MPRAPKTKIDPDAPSKPKTAYIFFSKAVRESIKQENSSLMPTEIMSAIAARWQAVSPAEKEQYSKMAEEDKVSYRLIQ